MSFDAEKNIKTTRDVGDDTAGNHDKSTVVTTSVDDPAINNHRKHKPSCDDEEEKEDEDASIEEEEDEEEEEGEEEEEADDGYSEYSEDEVDEYESDSLYSEYSDEDEDEDESNHKTSNSKTAKCTFSNRKRDRDRNGDIKNDRHTKARKLDTESEPTKTIQIVARRKGETIYFAVDSTKLSDARREFLFRKNVSLSDPAVLAEFDTLFGSIANKHGVVVETSGRYNSAKLNPHMLILFA